MTLLVVVLQVVAVVAALNLLCLAAVARVEDLQRALRAVRANTRAVLPSALGLGTVLAVNGVVRDIGVELSWLIGVNITGYIHAVEGRFVADLQSLATPELTAYFVFVYVFGYAFLLTFPLLAYVLADDTRPLRATLVAYSLNYGLGLACYVVFVAYGPRNLMPNLVDSLLYVSWPESQLLTSQVNVNTNVFPSLHASLAATVALLAHRFRVYPRWRPVAAFGAASVAVATMYLGIHWLVDVVAGVGVALASVAVATRVISETDGAGRDESARESRQSDVISRLVRALR